MNRLSLLSLAPLFVISTSVWAVSSQYACDRVIYENTLQHSERGLRVCFSDAGVTFTLSPKADGYEGIDKKVPLSAVTYVQKGIANTLTIAIDDDTHYRVSYDSQNLRLLTLYERQLSRAYRLNSPTVDNLSPTLARFGVHVQ